MPAEVKKIIMAVIKHLYSRTVIIIPSYNETDSLPLLVGKISLLYPKMRIIIIDDSPPIIQKRLRSSVLKKENVKVIFRKGKLGRGSAVIEGFKKALADKNNEYFVEMDADLSHDPSELPLFFEKMRIADVTVGSRYLQGSVIMLWPLWRIFFSRLINIFLEILLNLKLTDYTDGYRMYNRTATQKLTTMHLRESGFILLSESAYRLRHAGLKLTEVPIRFTDRKHGKSSVGLQELLTSLIGACKIRLMK